MEDQRRIGERIKTGLGNVEAATPPPEPRPMARRHPSDRGAALGSQRNEQEQARSDELVEREDVRLALRLELVRAQDDVRTGQDELGPIALGERLPDLLCGAAARIAFLVE